MSTFSKNVHAHTKKLTCKLHALWACLLCFQSLWCQWMSKSFESWLSISSCLQFCHCHWIRSAWWSSLEQPCLWSPDTWSRPLQLPGDPMHVCICAYGCVSDICILDTTHRHTSETHTYAHTYTHRITILLLLICSCKRFVADIFQFAKHFRDSCREAGETAVLIYIYIYIYVSFFY